MTALKVKTTISFVIGLIIFLLVSTLIFSLMTIDRLKSNLGIQVHTRTIIISLKNNLTFLLDAETGERGFMITGDSSYLEPYVLALKNISINTAQLRVFAEDNLSEQRALDTLEFYINQKLLFTKNLIALKKQEDVQAIKNIMATNQGKNIMDRIRLVNQTLQKQEETLFEERRANTAESIAIARIVFMVEGIFALVITVFLATAVIRELNRRSRTEKTITDKNTELERKNREIEQFAYVASHDLQEPLRSISNFSTLLTAKLETHPDETTRQYLGLIRGGAQRMSNLIFDLLEYSRIGNDMKKIEIDCNELVKEILGDMAASIKENNAEIHMSKLPVIDGYVYLKSLFQNLLSNALKFHKQGKTPVVHISAVNHGKEFLFSVKDNGIGIEKAYNERIFTIFQRLHSREEFPGTGIGLSQCKKIVELHGGRIWIESEPGKGTVFNFTIPKS